MVLLGFCHQANSIQAEDKVVGTVWQFGVKGKNGKTKWSHFFRSTPDKMVWNIPTTSVPRVIGSWSGTEENVKMNITGITHPKNVKHNGDYEFVLVGKAPKTWQGTFIQSETDKKTRIFIRLVKK